MSSKKNILDKLRESRCLLYKETKESDILEMRNKDIALEIIAKEVYNEMKSKNEEKEVERYSNDYEIV